MVTHQISLTENKQILIVTHKKVSVRGGRRSGVFSIMMTSSNGNISALLALCAGNSPVTGEFPTQRPVTRSFDVFFDLRLNKRLSKQSWVWWFEKLSRPLWRHCNGVLKWFHLHAPGMSVHPSQSTDIRQSWEPFNWRFFVHSSD